MAGICLPIDAVAGAPAFPAAQNRVADAALMQGRKDRSLGAVSGFRPGADPVITVTSARVWTATPSNGVVDPVTGPAVGPYRFAFLANESGTLDAADPNFTRFDRLDIQVPDDPAGGAPLSAIYVVTKGVAQSSPQVPLAPARSFPVGVFTVPNIGNPSFAATYPYCAASGGIIPTRTGYRPANPYVGQYVDDATTGLMRWDGLGWRQVGVQAVAAGQRPANPFVGQYIDDATAGLMRWDGTSWRQVGIQTLAAGARPATPYVGQYIDDAQFGLLRYNGATWKGVGGYRMQAHQNTDMSITNAYKKLTNWTSDLGADTALNGAAGTWTSPFAGEIDVAGQMVVSASGITYAIAYIYKNGAQFVGAQLPLSGTTVAAITIPTTTIPVAVGDTIEMWGNTSAATTTSTANSRGSTLNIRRTA